MNRGNMADRSILFEVVVDLLSGMVVLCAKHKCKPLLQLTRCTRTCRVDPRATYKEKRRSTRIEASALRVLPFVPGRVPRNQRDEQKHKRRVQKLPVKAERGSSYCWCDIVVVNPRPISIAITRTRPRRSTLACAWRSSLAKNGRAQARRTDEKDSRETADYSKFCPGPSGDFSFSATARPIVIVANEKLQGLRSVPRKITKSRNVWTEHWNRKT